MAHDVFISYSSKDKAVADAACATLEGRGIRCWIAPRDVLPGREWGASIIDAIQGSRAMVLVFSETANESRQIMREVNHAVEKGVAVVPFRIQDVMPSKAMEYYLDVTHWLDAMTPPVEDHLQELADKVELLLGQPAGEAELSPASREPSSAPRAALMQGAGGRGSSFLVNRKLPLWVVAGILLVAVAATVTYFVIRKSRSANEAARSEIMAVVNIWAETLRRRDLENNLRLYAERVSPFYTSNGVSREQVRANRQKMFASYPSIDVRLDNFAVEINQPGTEATVYYDNTYDWKGGAQPVSGKSRNVLILSKVGPQWLISGEKHIQTYYETAGD
jgi:ketosteroid isomerase-like protein